MFGGSCYTVEREQLTWADARARCVALGGHLVIIESHEEDHFVADLTESIISDSNVKRCLLLLSHHCAHNIANIGSGETRYEAFS